MVGILDFSTANPPPCLVISKVRRGLDYLN